MKKTLNSLLSFFNTNDEEEFYYVRIERNEKCYCESGKKYKSCHYPDHQKKSKVAVKKISETTGEETIKVLSVKKLRKEYYKVKSNVF
ncbi:SEC-C domain-containing protein [Labilibaculum sp. DW002]|uniref:SEC-C domain-containing protein n=1 Tax=Paralabilibaculum antarcticum TaxID=2912572 RepID=A0ABT5VS26_9BACT|nr:MULTISPECIES: SEC-C metal-binding domain-containing protein [unclassified Labilibaculum]MBI9056340.1 SEC-C domain-containing protein [Labilibaculum sp.]MDE5418226.1 SEC-C domain-containing protein [Labilibaculum sp. DW002]